MDRYFGLGNAQRSGDDNDINADINTAAGDVDIMSPFFDCENQRDSEPQGWD